MLGAIRQAYGQTLAKVRVSRQNSSNIISLQQRKNI